MGKGPVPDGVVHEEARRAREAGGRRRARAARFQEVDANVARSEQAASEISVAEPDQDHSISTVRLTAWEPLRRAIVVGVVLRDDFESHRACRAGQPGTVATERHAHIVIPQKQRGGEM